MDQANNTAEQHPATRHRSRSLSLSVLAVIAGLLIGWLDLHVTEVAVTILALLIGGLVMGLLEPAAPWRWAFFLVVGFPMMESMALVGGWQTAEPVQIDVRIWFVALAVAELGTYVGVFLRHRVTDLLSRSG